ncbi:MAG: glycosyltransferase family 2 protein [Rhodobiaceae bacterium]|nr:glycosyltransferase family 2 protein [Rhodobiaceae bacterium]
MSVHAINPIATIVIPAYNVEEYVADAVTSALAQTAYSFEVLVIDDGSTDNTVDIVNSFVDPRLRLISQPNGGLNNARNTGIHEARGKYIGFLDADDMWLPRKLSAHIAHMEANASIGMSFSPSLFIEEDGSSMGLQQDPQLTDITAADIIARNPIGNGSAALMRRCALEAIAYRPIGENSRDWYFDEDLVQSTDVECWLRLALTTDWVIEGIPECLTLYRTNRKGLSANIDRQFKTWQQMIDKTAGYAPAFIQQHVPRARAYQMRYLARRAVNLRDRKMALTLSLKALRAYPLMLIEEPIKTTATFGAALILKIVGPKIYAQAEQLAINALVYSHSEKTIPH